MRGEFTVKPTVVHPVVGGKKKSHLCLSAWLLVTAEMSQHLADCLPPVLAHLHASGPLTACL